MRQSNSDHHIRPAALPRVQLCTEACARSVAPARAVAATQRAVAATACTASTSACAAAAPACAARSKEEGLDSEDDSVGFLAAFEDVVG
jgi:hypothetical protein